MGLTGHLEANNFQRCLSELCWGGRSAVCGDRARAWLWGWAQGKAGLLASRQWASRLGVGWGASLWQRPALGEGPLSPVGLGGMSPQGWDEAGETWPGCGPES